MHQLAIDKYLVCADAVVNGISGIGARRNLDLTPLPIGRHEVAFIRPPLELTVHTLILNAALSLDERRVYNIVSVANIRHQGDGLTFRWSHS